MARDGDPFLEQWDTDLTTRKARRQHRGTIDLEKQQQVERWVTGFIRRSFRFVVIGVRDSEARREWESRIISTVSRCRVCGPSPGWLGLHSPKDKIRESGLWQEQRLYDEPLSMAEFDEQREMIRGALDPG